jgi:tripartite ATP-independent transporter DctP family solute receptor
MRRVSAVFFLSLIVCFLVSLSVQAVNLNVATPDPQTSPITLAAKHFGELVEEKTNGEVTVKVFADGVLFGGSPSNAVKQLGSGSIDMLTLSTSLYASFEPRFTAISVPYMFKDLDQLVNYLDGEPGQILADSLDRLGIEVVGYWTRPPRHLTNSKKPVDDVSDFEGLKLRVPNSPLWVKLFTALGANPVPMDFSEVYNALQLKVIDGQENPLGVPVSAKFYEVQDYLSLTGHILDGWVVGINQNKWDSLSNEHKKAITEAVVETRQWKLDYDAANREEFIKTLEENGMEVIELSEEALNDIREVARSVYPEFKELVGEEFFEMTLEFVQ